MHTLGLHLRERVRVAICDCDLRTCDMRHLLTSTWQWRQFRFLFIAVW